DPQVVEFALIAVGIEALAPKKPEMAAAIGPGQTIIIRVTASGNISGGRRSQRAVNSGLAADERATALDTVASDRAASAHPRPFLRGRIELPKVVEVAI